MDRLSKIGFYKVGNWYLDSGQLKYHLETDSNTNNVLYSFVSDRTIKYIGKTMRNLSQRMQNYGTPDETQRTNIRVNGKIMELLKNKKSVDIYILTDNGLLQYGNFTINLAAGLEDSLITKIRPDWNC